MDALRTLQILISSRTPLIAIEDLTHLFSRDRRADERRQIFGVHLSRHHRDPAVYDLVVLSEAAHGFSGAEIEQAVVSALYTAFARGAELATEHILEKIKVTKPLSVTRAEDIEALREWARGRAVPAA
jgi:SpoVK/Ycf46/Vps4 family AAA+-type ATPase